MTTTALDIITGAAKLLGVVFKSEALSSDEANDGLIALNDMISSWSNDNLLTYTYGWESFAYLAAGVASYSIGTGQTFNTSRPINIVAAFVRSGTIDYPLEIITPEQYELEIPVKTNQSSIQKFLTYDNGYPYGTIRLYPVPVSTGTIFLLSNKPLSSFALLTTAVDLPPGWNKALKFNLANDLAAEYGVQVAPQVVVGARESLAAIRKATSANNAMPLMPSLARGKPSILVGGF